MIRNTAFLAALTTFLLAAWLAGELAYLAPYKSLLFRSYGAQIGAVSLLVFLDLFGIYYLAARWLFLRDAGRKLTHVDRELLAGLGGREELRRFLRASRR